MGDYRDLLAFKKAFILAMDIYHQTKSFPIEEKLSLTRQIRRSSRSVCVNLVEAYKRRRYKNYFLSKPNDSESENAETQVWLEFSISCNYMPEARFQEFTAKNTEVAKLILYMINHPDKFTFTND